MNDLGLMGGGHTTTDMEGDPETTLECQEAPGPNSSLKP